MFLVNIIVWIVILIICALPRYNYCLRHTANVCRRLEDYLTIGINPNCWYTPEVSMTTDEIVARYGFPLETYDLTSEDGFILTIHRIPHNGTNRNGRQPVFIQHGLGMNSEGLVLIGKDSIPFLLSNRGYDVWLGNARGTAYSRRHLKYTVDTWDYWNFSFHEMAVYDLPAIIDFIFGKTNRKILYIGYSMGTITSMVYSSIDHHQAEEKLSSIVALAPAIYMSNAKSPMVWRLIAWRKLIQNFMERQNIFAFDISANIFQNWFGRFCSLPPNIGLCFGFYTILLGMEPQELRPEIVPKFLQRHPSGISLRTVMHVSQMMLANNRFQQYDYGPEANRRVYNSSRAPLYELEKVKLPVHIFYGRNDLLCGEKDSKLFYTSLTGTKKKTITHLLNDTIRFSHLDFVTNRHSQQVVQLILDTVNSK